MSKNANRGIVDGLRRKRCFNHARREAAGRCPECRRYHCRECLTEHEGRVVCASCLAKLSSPSGAEPRSRRLFSASVLVTLWLASLAILWIFFYGMGRGLTALPDSFHEGTLWHESIWDEE